MDQEEKGNGSPSRIPIFVTLSALAGLAVLWPIAATADMLAWDLALALLQVAVISIVIWQACDPFADAAQWIGTSLRIPGSVRGATLDAIASSMPELFSGIFFVVVAISVATSEGGTPEQLERAGGEGYGATVATCAGSAVYNMILIPAFCALFISFARKRRPTIDVESKVISRDGLWFVGCEIVLIVFLFQSHMYWWMALVFMSLYVVYIFQLYRDARTYQIAHRAIRRKLDELHHDLSMDELLEALQEEGIRPSPMLIDEVRDEMRQEAARNEDDEDEPPKTAGVLFGYVQVPLSNFTAWAVIGVATVVAAAACYWLVDVTRGTAETLGAPIFFVAVILAAAASSVPDTFLSIGAARRGDDSGAVSNAFGSNIFDICICLSVPLLVNSFLNGWQPVALLQDGEPMPGLVGIRVLLAVLTLMTLLIMWHNRQLTRNKALVLCFLYGIFVAYAVAGSLGFKFWGLSL